MKVGNKICGTFSHSIVNEPSGQLGNDKSS